MSTRIQGGIGDWKEIVNTYNLDDPGKKRRNFILLLDGTSTGTLTVGSSAFSSGAAERGINVGVVPDDHAYVGYEIQGDGDSNPPEIVVTAGEYEELVRVTNRCQSERRPLRG